MNDRVLSLSGVHARRGNAEVLRGLELSVRRDELLAILGASGGGKTTALRTIVALDPFERGAIDVGGFALPPGVRLPESKLRDLRKRVGMVFQFHYLFEHLSVLDNIVLAPTRAFGIDRGKAEAHARELLQMLGVEHRAEAFPDELSGGEAQRVAIARALAVDPPLLLMDEPTAALDPARRSSLGGSLRALAAEGRGIVVATHDVSFVAEHATRVAVMAEGKIVEEGDPARVLSAPQHPETRRLLKAEQL